MNLEDTLKGWTGPSSDTEQEKQERTERMIREAIANHAAFDGFRFSVYTKGSYANSTNVRADSDVDVAVQCHEAEYWTEDQPGSHVSKGTYRGPWTPAKLRREVGAALRAKFPSQVDDSGSTAFTVKSGTARVDADVVPCFDFCRYFASGTTHVGTRIVTKDGHHFENYPAQQLKKGKEKNKRTKMFYKPGVRVLKRIENDMVNAKVHREAPSFFMECLGYNCPDSIFMLPSWTGTVRAALAHIWTELQGAEPKLESKRWREANDCKYLFSGSQDWNRSDGRDFAKAAWNYLGYKP